MNTQINELANQATDEILGVKVLDKNKFAKLLIEDCVRLLVNNGYTDAAKCLHDIHFGISDAP